MTEVRIPQDLWEEDDKTGSISVWLYKDGSKVKQGDVLAEVMVEKVTFELKAPEAGTLRIKVETEIVVNKGDVVAILE